MRIIGAEIDWADGYANSPRLIVSTDGPVPRREEMRYERLLMKTHTSGLSREQEAITGARERTIEVLYAEHPSGYVSFVMVGSETSHCGTSGGDFTLTDGKRVHVRSGWTISSAAIAERAEVVECVFREGPDRYGRIAGFLLASRAREVLAEFLPDVEMYDDGTGLTYKWGDAPTKREWQRAEHERWVEMRCPECGGSLSSICRARSEGRGPDRSCPGFYDGRRPYSRWPEYVAEGVA